jgi:hypothetical protein
MPFSYRKLPRGVFFVLAALILAGSAVALKQIGLKPKNQSAHFPAFQKGMVYADWTKEGYATFASDDSLKEMTKTKTEWVALVVTWYQDAYNTPQIKATHRTSSDNSLSHAIRRIHDLGLKVMLKPHLDIMEISEGKWRGEIEFSNPQDWQNWFNQYRDFILHYVEIANTENVEMICLGTELTSSTLNHPEQWRQLISQVRGMYKGQLTYAANWHEEYQKIAFWDLLDYAGVDPYFPLTEAKAPTVEELKKAWQPWVKQLEEWQDKLKKPVIFTEVGYKSSEGAADSPWEHTPKGALDLQTQANCYRAFLETFYYKKWAWGIYWWYWQVSINPRLSMTRGFSPRGKPAEEILTKWYSKPDPGIEKAYYLSVLKEGLGKKEAAIAPPMVPVSEAVAASIPESSAAESAVPAAPVAAVETPPVSAVSAPVVAPAPGTVLLASADVSTPPVAPEAVPAVTKTIVPAANIKDAPYPAWQKGMCYLTWNKDSFKNASSDESLSLLKPLGVEWVSFSPTWYQEKYNSTVMRSNNKTPTDEGLIHAIQKARELGMKILLKPHLDLIDQSDGRWRGEIEFTSDQEWEAWFKSYRDFILHYAQMAAEQGAELFCIGTELTRPALAQPNRWRQLIQEIRAIYPGRLTYAANWYDEYYRIEFWDLLDYAGVDPYFPLIEKDRPSLEEIRTAWKVWENLLEEWQAKVKKPIIFVEIGYKSSSATTDQPWVAQPGKQVELELQKDCYQVLLELFWNKPWFYGLYWWYWGTHANMGGEFNRGYTPQNKPAENVIKDWYHKPTPHS